VEQQQLGGQGTQQYVEPPACEAEQGRRGRGPARECMRTDARAPHGSSAGEQCCVRLKGGGGTQGVGLCGLGLLWGTLWLGAPVWDSVGCCVDSVGWGCCVDCVFEGVGWGAGGVGLREWGADAGVQH